MKTRKLLIALIMPAAVALAGCGGASDEKGGNEAAASGGSGDQQTLSLVAYSTPQVVYDELIPAFARPHRARASASRPRSARRATRRAPSRRARRPMS